MAHNSTGMLSAANDVRAKCAPHALPLEVLMDIANQSDADAAMVNRVLARRPHFGRKTAPKRQP